MKKNIVLFVIMFAILFPVFASANGLSEREKLLRELGSHAERSIIALPHILNRNIEIKWTVNTSEGEAFEMVVGKIKSKAERLVFTVTSREKDLPKLFYLIAMVSEQSREVSGKIANGVLNAETAEITKADAQKFALFSIAQAIVDHALEIEKHIMEHFRAFDLARLKKLIWEKKITDAPLGQHIASAFFAHISIPAQNAKLSKRQKLLLELGRFSIRGEVALPYLETSRLSRVKWNVGVIQGIPNEMIWGEIRVDKVVPETSIHFLITSDGKKLMGLALSAQTGKKISRLTAGTFNTHGVFETKQELGLHNIHTPLVKLIITHAQTIIHDIAAKLKVSSASDLRKRIAENEQRKRKRRQKQLEKQM